jgi:hypothetical protein
VKPHSKTGAAELVRIPATSLYRRSQATPGEAMIFLRWSVVASPDTLAIHLTWANSGPPAEPGYYVFLNEVPPDATAPAFEEALRGLLVKPAATGFVWALYLAPAKASMQTAIQMSLGAANQPMVADSVTMQLPPGVRTLGFRAQTPVASMGTAPSIDGFVFTYPPLPGSDPPTGAGISLGIDKGTIGCLRFDALVNVRPVKEGATEALKALVQVQIDPIRPFDPQRTYQRFSGSSYFLRVTGDGHHLSPASPHTVEAPANA